MSDAPQSVRFAAREAVTLVVTMTQNGSISGWLITFTARTQTGTLIVQKTVGSGITITDPGGAGSPGVFEIALGTADTALFVGSTTYPWDCWRTNSGSEARLAYGAISVDRQQRV